MSDSSELQVRKTSAGVSTSGTPEVGVGADLAEVSFDRPALLHDNDIPTAFRSGAATSSSLARAELTGPDGASRPGGELVRAERRVPPRSEAAVAQLARESLASGVRQLAKPRKRGDRVVLRRIGWRATPDAVVITTAEQELTERAAKRYAPSGPWQIEHRVTYRHRDGRAEKRVGQVPMDRATEDAGVQPAEAPTEGVQAQVSRQFPEGAEALSFLPKAVRASVIARVPLPTLFDGGLIAYCDSDTGAISRREVNVLRMTEETAVVVHAELPDGSTSWQVSQATYALTDPEIEQV